MRETKGRDIGGVRVYREDIPEEAAHWAEHGDGILAGNALSEYVLTLTDAQARRVWEREDAGLDPYLPTPETKPAAVRGLRTVDSGNAAGYAYVNGYALGAWAAYGGKRDGWTFLHVPSGLTAPAGTRYGIASADAARRVLRTLHALPVVLLQGLTWGMRNGHDGVRGYRADLRVLMAVLKSEPVTPEMLEAVRTDAALEAPAIAPEAVTPEPETAPEPVTVPAPKPARKRPTRAARSTPETLTVDRIVAAVMAAPNVTPKMAARVAGAYLHGAPANAVREAVPAGDALAAMIHGCGPSSVGHRRGDGVLAALQALTGTPVPA